MVITGQSTPPWNLEYHHYHESVWPKFTAPLQLSEYPIHSTNLCSRLHMDIEEKNSFHWKCMNIASNCSYFLNLEGNSWKHCHFIGGLRWFCFTLMNIINAHAYRWIHEWLYYKRSTFVRWCCLSRRNHKSTMHRCIYTYTYLHIQHSRLIWASVQR